MSVRVRPRRVAVQRHVLHVVALVEDLLRAVAVVVVDVEHGHLRAGASTATWCGGDRRVVEEAVAAVVATSWRGGPGGRHSPYASALAAEHALRSRRARSRRPTGRPRTCPPSAASSSRSTTSRAGRRSTSARRPAPSRARRPGTVEHVGHDVVGRVDLALVLVPRRGEEAHEPGVVHGLDRRRCPHAVGSTIANAASAAERGADRLGPAGVLERRLQPRRSISCSGSWQPVARRDVDDLHRRTRAQLAQLELLVEVLLAALGPLQLARRRLRQRARLDQHHVARRQPAHLERAVVDRVADASSSASSAAHLGDDDHASPCPCSPRRRRR